MRGPDRGGLALGHAVGRVERHGRAGRGRRGRRLLHGVDELVEQKRPGLWSPSVRAPAEDDVAPHGESESADAARRGLGGRAGVDADIPEIRAEAVLHRRTGRRLERCAAAIRSGGADRRPARRSRAGRDARGREPERGRERADLRLRAPHRPGLAGLRLASGRRVDLGHRATPRRRTPPVAAGSFPGHRSLEPSSRAQPKTPSQNDGVP